MPVTPRAPRIDPTRADPLPTIFPSRPPLTIPRTGGSPWSRRHTLGELPIYKPAQAGKTRHHSNTSMEAEDRHASRARYSVTTDTDGGSSPTPSERSEGGSLTFLTSETYQLVKDMDREEREGNHDDVPWQKKFSRDPSTASRPWLYRRYSHQIQSMESDDLPTFSTQTLGKTNKRIADWDYDDIQAQVKKYVDTCKHEKMALEEFDESLEEEYDLPEGTTNNFDQSQSSIALLGDSGYMTSSNVSQMGDTSMEPLALDLPHYDLAELPVEIVDPRDYPELVYECPQIPPVYTSTVNITLEASGSTADSEVQARRLIVLAANQLKQFRLVENKITEF